MKKKVLFVCLGNICRSPLAESLFNKEIKAHNLNERFSADSCGTGNWHIGSPPDERILALGEQYDLHFNHKARQLRIKDFARFDFIVAMDKNNYHDMITLLQQSGISTNANIVMMRDFDAEAMGEDVPDPYFEGSDGFQEVYNILFRSIRNFVDYLKENQRPG